MEKSADSVFSLFQAFLPIALLGGYLGLVGSYYGLESSHTLILILLAIQILPVFVCLQRGNPDYLVFIFVSYALTYTYNRWGQLQISGEFPPTVRAELREMILCNFLTLATYYLIRRLLIDSSEVQERLKDLSFSTNQVYVFVWLFVLFDFLTYLKGSDLERIFLGFSSVLCVVPFCTKREIASRAIGVSRAVVVLATSLKVMMAAMLGAAIHLVFVLVPLIFLRRRYKLFLILIPGLFLGVVFHSIKGLYRQAVWYGGEDQSFFQKIELVKELIEGIYFSDYGNGAVDLEEYKNTLLTAKRASLEGFDYDEEIFSGIDSVGAIDILLATGGRAADESLERVLDRTPKEVPFWNGETYLNAIYTFVPRFMWAEKPQWLAGSAFGHAYGYLDPSDQITSIAYSYLTEGYMNFGYVGLYLVAILFGLLLVGLEWVALYNTLGNNVVWYLFLLTPFLSYQIDFLSIFQTTIINLCVLVVFCEMVRLSTLGAYKVKSFGSTSSSRAQSS